MHPIELLLTMALFQNTVLEKYTSAFDSKRIDEAYSLFCTYFHDKERQKNILQSKEEQFQEGFLRELFVRILGYTLNPDPDFNLITEKKDTNDSKKADGAILVSGEVVGIIELKDHKTPDLSKVERQAFGYKNQHKKATYVIISNFQFLRFYIDNAVEYVEWNLFTLSRQEFNTLWLCLQYDNICSHLPRTVKEASVSNEEQITSQLYKDYITFKRDLFQDILNRNVTPEGEHSTAEWKIILFKKTQKLLDRLLFIFFAEDEGLLPPNAMRSIISQWRELIELDEDIRLYSRIKKYFGYMNTGYKGKKYEVFAYNGGLFKPDDILDNLEIDDELLATHTQRLADYDFASEVDVNILGHIFENSLTEIEEVTAQLQQGAAPTVSKRKKDGVFYTPQYITRYIVENTVGRLCSEKKAEMGIVEEDYYSQTKHQTKTKQHMLDLLAKYREWLLQLTICDPACGSGAFLNAALRFLMDEHHRLDQMEASITGSAIVFEEVENSILENNLYGVDINEESVEIARLSLWLRTAKPYRKLTTLNGNIKCGNSLISDPAVAGDKAFDWQKEFPQVFAKGGFDVVIGNPPYGAEFSEKDKEYIKNNFKSYKYKYESYIYFLEQAINLVKATGYLEFITPSLWLSLDNAFPIREIVNQYDIQTIRVYGDNVFADAIVNTCTVLIKKQPKTENVQIQWDDNNIYTVLKEDLVNSDSLQIDYRINPIEKSIIKKIQNRSKDLSFYGNVIQGITPYDSYRGQSKEIIQNRAYHLDYCRDETCGHWLDGKHLSRYMTTWGGEWLSYGEWLAAPREKKFFEGKRLLFREIPGARNRIQASLVTEVCYYGHSISPFKPFKEYEEVVSVLLALVNSSLISWYGTLVLPNMCKSVFPKINPQDISKLPIPNIDDKALVLGHLADTMLTTTAELQKLRSRFHRRMKENLGIEKITTALEASDLLSFAELQKELKKQKVKLTLVQQDEWEEYFLNYQRQCQNLLATLAFTDAEIDRKVYELYGLTEDEIRVVEGK